MIAASGAEQKPPRDGIRSKLWALAEYARQIVAIGDAAANLLWVTGDPDTCERAREMRFQAGAEHLVGAVHPWTCSAAPIHDPPTGELIGVADLTANLRTNHPHTLSVAALAALAAEAVPRLLRLAESLRERWERLITRRRSPSALLDRNGWVIASRGIDDLPGRLRLGAAANSTAVLPDGRLGELELLDGGAAILWLCAPTRSPWVALTGAFHRARDASGGAVNRTARARAIRRAWGRR